MSLSNYANGLSSEAKTRYLEKFQMFDSDCPYCMVRLGWWLGRFHRELGIQYGQSLLNKYTIKIS